MVPEAGLEPAHPWRRGILTLTYHLSMLARLYHHPNILRGWTLFHLGSNPSYFLLLSHLATAQVVVEPSVSDGLAADCPIYF